MSELGDACVVPFRRADVGWALARRYGLPGPEAVTEATDRTIPIVVEALARRVAERDGADELVEIVTTIDHSGLVDPAAVFAAGEHEAVGSRLIRHLMDDRATRRQLARQTSDDPTDGSGPGLLAAVAWMSAAQLRRRTARPGPVEPPVDRTIAETVGTGEDRAGLGPVPVPRIGSATIVSGQVVEAESDPDPDPPSDGSGIDDGADRRSAETSSVSTARAELSDPTVDETLPSWSSAPVSTPTSARSAQPEAEVSVGSSRIVIGLAVVLFLLVVAGVALLWLDRQGVATADLLGRIPVLDGDEASSS